MSQSSSPSFSKSERARGREVSPARARPPRDLRVYDPYRYRGRRRHPQWKLWQRALYLLFLFSALAAVSATAAWTVVGR